MSALGNFLTGALTERRLRQPTYTAARFAKDLGIAPAMLSRFMSGQTRQCEPQTLERIIQNISPERERKAELLAAYVRDQLVGPTRGDVVVYVDVGSSRVREEPPEAGEVASLDALAKELASDREVIDGMAELLRACGKSRRLRRSLLDLADIARHDINAPRKK